METMEATRPAVGGAYEFSAAHNQVIDRAGSRVRWWGAFTGGAGLLMMAGAVVALFSGEAGATIAGLIYGALALIPIFVGLHFVRSGSALKAVVNTAGSDIAHMMNALDNLSRAFTIQLVAASIWLILAIIGGVLAFSLSSLG